MGMEPSLIPAYGSKVKDGFVFHDLRHTFATNARRAGIPRNVIMAIMGNSTGGDMNARYDKIEDSDLLEAIDRIEEVFSANVAQTVAKGAKTRERVKGS